MGRGKKQTTKKADLTFSNEEKSKLSFSEDQKSKLSFSEDQKSKLAKLVKVREPLWNISHPDYKKSPLISKAWREIAAELKITETEAKKQWKSLKDALRYRKVAKMTKSGDSQNDAYEDDILPELDHSEIQNWNLWEDMRFVLDSKPQRITLSSDLSNCDPIPEVTLRGDGERLTTPSNEETKLESNVKRPASNYDYMAASKKKSRSSLDEGTEKLVDGIQSLVDLRKEKAKSSDLKYMSIYRNLDRMLSQLPDGVVEDLNMEFMNLAYVALKNLA